MTTAHNITRAIRRALSGYTVHAPQWQATHRAESFTDALSWAACYPAHDLIIITRWGRFMAAR